MKSFNVFGPGGLEFPVRRPAFSLRPSVNATLPETALVPIFEGQTWSVGPGERVEELQVVARDPEGFCAFAPLPGRIEKFIPLESGWGTQAAVIRFEGAFQVTGRRQDVRDWQSLSPLELWRQLCSWGLKARPSSLQAPRPWPSPETPPDQILLGAANSEPYHTLNAALLEKEAEVLSLGLKMLQHLYPKARFAVALPEKPGVKSLPPWAAGLPQRSVPDRYPFTHSQLTSPEALMIDLDSLWMLSEACRLQRPLLEKFVTVEGSALTQPVMLKVRLGTPLFNLLQDTEGVLGEQPILLEGGPLKGRRWPALWYPITLQTQVVTILKPGDLNPGTPEPCTRCGQCLEVCPVSLQPQVLYEAHLNGEGSRNWPELLNACLECGLCEYVCPSHLPLLKTFQALKNPGAGGSK